MKGYSERVPNKNFRLLGNKPFFFYIADTLRETGLFTHLVINTDSNKISDLAEERYKDWVIVIKRPKELCGDYVSMNEIIACDVETIGINCEYMQTHSTSPFLSAETIESAAKIYQKKSQDGNIDSLFSVNALRTRLYDSNLRPINHNPSDIIRTQDLNVVYEENSNFYFFSGQSFMVKRHRIGINAICYPMSRSSIECLDVDDMDDWRLAEMICNLFMSQD